MEGDRISGASAVAALFARRPDAVLRLFYNEQQRRLAGPWCALLAEMRRPYRMLEEPDLAKAAGTPRHGGIVAVATPRELPYLDFDHPPRHRLLLVLDGVANPYNLGAIARCAAFFGAPAMLFHDLPGAALPSDAAYRVAEGGLEWPELYRTRDLRRALLQLDPLYRTVAFTSGPESVPFRELPRDRPVALVLGHEERGVSIAAQDACRRKVRLTGSGRIESLNIAQSAAILLHALTQS